MCWGSCTSAIAFIPGAERRAGCWLAGEGESSPAVEELQLLLPGRDDSRAFLPQTGVAG